MLTLPVYDAVQKLAHMYYRRALKRGFFEGGRDMSLTTMANQPYCPNLLFGACLHDYRKPWEQRPNFCDFTLSTLFVGCERTGFFQTPENTSLARWMTIAGDYYYLSISLTLSLSLSLSLSLYLYIYIIHIYVYIYIYVQICINS